jgi:PPM family protein phosphatase
MQPHAPTLMVHASGQTDVGVKRKNNEDAFGLGVVGTALLHPGDVLRFPVEKHGALLVVSDGLGGEKAGEVASRLAVATLHGELGGGTAPAGEESLRRAFLAADQAVRAAGALRKEHQGMGATLSAVWLHPEGAWFGHVGDSRIYRWRDAELTQISRDHSPVGRMRQAGQINEEEARRHPYRSVIDQSLGGDPQVFAPDVGTIPLLPGDALLLCTDGLTDGVSDAEINAALGRLGTRTPARVCADLVAAARKNSGRDNITVVAGHVHTRPRSHLARLASMLRRH